MDPKLPASHSLQLYYVAVGNAKVKLDSLIELITALECTGPLSLVICCGSRDVLDTVAAALHSLDSLSLWCLHADMSEREMDAEVQSFRRSVAAITAKLRPPKEQVQAQQPPDNYLHEHDPEMQPNEQVEGPSSRQGAPAVVDADKPVFRPLCALITTDAPLRAVNKDLLPMAPTLLINFDITTRKEEYSKRVAAVLGGRARAEGQRLCINFLEAGKVAELRQLEVFAEREVKEMPVHVADVFQGSRRLV